MCPLAASIARGRARRQPGYSQGFGLAVRNCANASTACWGSGCFSCRAVISGTESLSTSASQSEMAIS